MDASDEYRERLATIEAALALEDRSAANVVRAVGAEFAKTHKHLVAMLCDPALDEGLARRASARRGPVLFHFGWRRV